MFPDIHLQDNPILKLSSKCPIAPTAPSAFSIASPASSSCPATDSGNGTSTWVCNHFFHQQLKPYSNYTSDSGAAFLSSFNVLTHFHTLNSIENLFTNSSQFTTMLPSLPLYQRILLEATSLCTAVNSYNGSAGSLSSVLTILASPVPGKLPIVIDTGASCSNTPIWLDFTGPIGKWNKESLGSLTQVKTTVDGVGLVLWDIEDINGVAHAIETTAYYVYSATICLFSPQV